jgi:outer membrane protein assembly factor BamE (lipoprotein component of BamABCDE complex)
MPPVANHRLLTLNPSLRQMRTHLPGVILLMIAALLISGCAGTASTQLGPITPGMTPEEVSARLGEPSRREQFAPDRYIYFYDQGNYRDRPVCFDKHRVVHVGQELLDRWRQERLTLASSGGTLSPNAKKEALATLTAERENRIAELEQAVKPLPVSATGENLKIYRELLSLAPDNERYQRKVAFYSERHETEQTAKRRAAEAAAKRKQETARKQRNKTLRVYEGNDNIEMAVHELGDGEIYVWVKNLSTGELLLVASQYRLLDANEKPIAHKVGAELQGPLASGGIAYGKLTLDPKTRPSRLVLAHPTAGTIEKWFP